MRCGTYFREAPTSTRSVWQSFLAPFCLHSDASWLRHHCPLCKLDYRPLRDIYKPIGYHAWGLYVLVGRHARSHQIAPLYKGMRSRYNPIAFCIFHNILYIVVSLVYYVFFCLTICPLATALLAEDHLPVESIFPIIVFPVIAVIGMARISRLYSAPVASHVPTNLRFT